MKRGIMLTLKIFNSVKKRVDGGIIIYAGKQNKRKNVINMMI